MKFTFTTPLTQQNLDAIAKACMFPIVRITVEQAKRLRSVNQNAYYWGVVIPHIIHMFQDAGQPASPDDVHQYLKERVGKLCKMIETPDGLSFITGTTTNLSTAQFENYLEAVRAWAASYGCLIPLPNESI